MCLMPWWNAQKRIRKLLQEAKNEKGKVPGTDHSRLAAIDEQLKRDLGDLAEEFGCVFEPMPPGSTAHPALKHSVEDIVRMIQEAARSWREANLWAIALVSAIASVVSAIGAWAAVCYAT